MEINTFQWFSFDWRRTTEDSLMIKLQPNICWHGKLSSLASHIRKILKKLSERNKWIKKGLLMFDFTQQWRCTFCCVLDRDFLIDFHRHFTGFSVHETFLNFWKIPMHRQTISNPNPLTMNETPTQMFSRNRKTKLVSSGRLLPQSISMNSIWFI